MNHPDVDAIMAEFQRLGLNNRDIPGLAVGPGGLDSLLEHLRSLSPGATWHQALPDLPKHWIPGNPATWTRAYRPFGPYDYQELPTGPAVHVSWPKPGEPGRLDRVLSAARQAGWPVYGAGLVESTNPLWPSVDALIVLQTGTDEDRVIDFTEWLETQGVSVDAVPRAGTESYYSPPAGAA